VSRRDSPADGGDAGRPGLCMLVPLMHALYGPEGIITLPDGSFLFRGERGDFVHGLYQ
jgi:hypothetical protein